ncbi:hypothetical protein MMC29_006664, partial [Sticta canariensis]|nr:hypothetical protein [Sticta canariensis]
IEDAEDVEDAEDDVSMLTSPGISAMTNVLSISSPTKTKTMTIAVDSSDQALESTEYSEYSSSDPPERSYQNLWRENPIRDAKDVLLYKRSGFGLPKSGANASREGIRASRQSVGKSECPFDEEMPTFDLESLQRMNDDVTQIVRYKDVV